VIRDKRHKCKRNEGVFLLLQTITILMLLEVAGADGFQEPTGNRIVASRISNETRWRGTLRDQAEIRMDLKREGQNLVGTVTYNYKSGPGSGPYEVKGKLEKNDKFTVIETTGVVWEGRFISPSKISGVRYNGPADDPRVPKWPVTMTQIGTLPMGSIKERTEVGLTSKDWSTFFSAFRTAVKNHDREALKTTYHRIKFFQIRIPIKVRTGTF
jgi:hypothetical protein